VRLALLSDYSGNFCLFLFVRSLFRFFDFIIVFFFKIFFSCSLFSLSLSLVPSRLQNATEIGITLIQTFMYGAPNCPKHPPRPPKPLQWWIILLICIASVSSGGLLLIGAALFITRYRAARIATSGYREM